MLHRVEWVRNPVLLGLRPHLVSRSGVVSEELALGGSRAKTLSEPFRRKHHDRVPKNGLSITSAYNRAVSLAPPPEVPFQAHIEHLHTLLARRDGIVERIQALLNAQRKPAEYLQDGARLSRDFEDCLDGQWRLRGQLEAAHWASGFRPRQIPGLHNGPADPPEMMMRAFYLWQQTRWPGRNGRVRYAHTLFNLHVVRALELLSMRVWDAGAGGAGSRLAQVQDVLDHLWRNTTVDQPRLVRDARWLIQTAQSLATDDLGAYFRVAEHVANRLPDDDRIEIHKAGLRMAAGHLRSQIRYHATKKAASLDETGVVLSTRDSNALDFALLIQDLVPVLEAYERAWHDGDSSTRLELADVICQGVSPDPELFLNRVELLGAYSMIEPLFTRIAPDGHAAYTPIGERHVRLLQDYQTRVGRVSKPLSEDCPRFRPVAGEYSPYGVLYGFSADLLKHMVLKTAHADAVSHFGLEDVFVAGDADKRSWVTGWRKLPHLTREMAKQFDYPQQFAEDVFNRVEQALRRRVSNDTANDVPHTGRLFILQPDDSMPDLPAQYIASSDTYAEKQLLSDRREGKFVVSYETPGGWRAITKTMLTEVLAAGHDAKVVGLPPDAVGVLKLMCPRLVM